MSFCCGVLAQRVVRVVSVQMLSLRSVTDPIATNIKGTAKILVLDYNIVSYVLNGELWLRSKSTLMKYRRKLQALFEAGHGLEALPLRDPELRRLIAVYRWVMEEVPKRRVSYKNRTPMQQMHAVKLSLPFQSCTQ